MVRLGIINATLYNEIINLGIYVSFFNPDTVEVDDDMSVTFYSFENPEDLVYVEGATAVLSPLMILEVNK